MSSSERTQRMFLIEEHYRNIGSALAWNVDRFLRLCGALQLTPYEVGAYIRCPASQVNRWLKQNRFPPTVELHLTLIERALLPDSDPVFPVL